MEIDLFAANWNAQFLKFVAPNPHPGSFATDAFSLDWNRLKSYVFPPFGLIAKCLGKIRKDKAEVVMICPYWPSQFWFSDLLEMTSDTPRILLHHQDLLLSCRGMRYQLIENGSLQLIAWKLSGINTKAWDYRKKLSKFCWRGIIQIRQLHTSQPGNHGLIGIWKNAKIPCMLV